MNAAPAQSPDPSAPRGESRGSFIPALLLVIAVVGWAGFQTFQLVTERTTLTEGIASQDSQMEQSRKVRAALENIATRTARIAQAGNANATLIVEELRKRGISINADAPPPAQ